MSIVVVLIAGCTATTRGTVHSCEEAVAVLGSDASVVARVPAGATGYACDGFDTCDLCETLLTCESGTLVVRHQIPECDGGSDAAAP